jgi:hypothetical protein
MSFTRFYSVSNLIYDPAIAPTKAIQNVYAHDNSHWQQPSRPRYDTTYRSEFINRIRHPVCILLTQWNCVLFFFIHTMINYIYRNIPHGINNIFRIQIAKYIE